MSSVGGIGNRDHEPSTPIRSADRTRPRIERTRDSRTGRRRAQKRSRIPPGREALCAGFHAPMRNPGDHGRYTAEDVGQQHDVPEARWRPLEPDHERTDDRSHHAVDDSGRDDRPEILRRQWSVRWSSGCWTTARCSPRAASRAMTSRAAPDRRAGWPGKSRGDRTRDR